MKIGMVCYPSYGGSGVVATELGKHLAYRGHEVHFITYARPFKLNKFYENIFFHEVEEIHYPVFKYNPYTISLANKIASVARHANLDVVHVHYAIPHSISAFLAKNMLKERPLPVVTTLHGTDITLVAAQAEFFDVTKLGIESSDALTSVSDSLTRETRETMQLTNGIKTIYNFIDPEEYRRLPPSGLRCRFAWPKEKIITHISNFRPVKRVFDVINTFRLIQAEIPARLILIGDGPESSAVEKYVDKCGLREKVLFLGKQDSVVELLSISDLFLLPSEKESFGLAALEAMACEVPVVASNAGGIPELVQDGVTGFLAPIGDVEMMAKHSLQILSDPDLHKKFAQQGRERAVRYFHVDSIIPQYEQIYQSIQGR